MQVRKGRIGRSDMSSVMMSSVMVVVMGVETVKTSRNGLTEDRRIKGVPAARADEFPKRTVGWGL